MVLREFSYQFDDLTVDLKGIHALLGYAGLPLPAPFDEHLEEALAFARQLTDIRAVCRKVEDIRLEPSAGRIVADGRTFSVGKTVCKELKNAEELLFFVCTAGKSISDRSKLLIQGEDPARGYIYDQVGIFITEAAGDRMMQSIREELPAGMKTTNRYSPGYCHWAVSDQHLLFSLFPSAPCGVTLTESALMNPIKSISGVIGLGKAVSYRDYPCTLCLSLNCIYRKIS